MLMTSLNDDIVKIIMHNVRSSFLHTAHPIRYHVLMTKCKTDNAVCTQRTNCKVIYKHHFIISNIININKS